MADTLTTAEELEIRQWVGRGPTLVELQAFHEAIDAEPLRVALHILKMDLADLERSPTKFSSAGDLSEDWTGRRDDLASRIANLEENLDGTAAAVGASIGSGDAVREDRSRMFLPEE